MENAKVMGHKVTISGDLMRFGGYVLGVGLVHKYVHNEIKYLTLIDGVSVPVRLLKNALDEIKKLES
jgi:hypothetical protein